MLAGKYNLSLSTLTRYRLGNALVWTGVLAWAPFIILRAMGHRPSLLWFLPFHLMGVIGGSRLRTAARREMGADLPKNNWLRTAGHGLFYLGITVWVPYLYLKFFTQSPVEVTRFLPFHLTGIFGGITLLVLGTVVNNRKS